MQRKRKKTHSEATEPTDEEWRRTIDLCLVLRMLRSAASQRRAEHLAVVLEREALDV